MSRSDECACPPRQGARMRDSVAMERHPADSEGRPHATGDAAPALPTTFAAILWMLVGVFLAPRERGRYQAFFSAVWAAASVIGPGIGGVLAEHLTWTLIFWINLPLGLVALLMSSAQLKRLPRYERPHKLDVLGAGLMA